MSVEAMAIALHHSRAKGAIKLVLLGIANHDGDGGAWPSVRTLARYAACSPRHVQNAIADLERLGEVRRSVMGGGTRDMADHMRPNLYHFTLSCPPGCDRSKNHKMPKEVIAVELLEEGPDPLNPSSPGGPHFTGPVNSGSPEPSLNQTTQEREQLPVQAHATPAASAARYERAIASKCAGWSKGRHDYNPAGYCNFCGTHRDDVLGVNPSTGEIK